MADAAKKLKERAKRIELVCDELVSYMGEIRTRIKGNLLYIADEVDAISRMGCCASGSPRRLVS